MIQMDTPLQLEGFNERLLSASTGGGKRAIRLPVNAGWFALAAGLAVSGYWGWHSGAGQRAIEAGMTSVRHIVAGDEPEVVASIAIKPIPIRGPEMPEAVQADREQALARIDELEAGALRRQTLGQGGQNGLNELERQLRLVEKKPAGEVAQPERVALPERKEAAAPIVVSRAHPEARRKQEMAVAKDKPAVVQAKPIETRAAVVGTVRPEEEQSGLMLFKKRDTAAPVAAATPVSPVAMPAQPSAERSPSVDFPQAAPGIRPPVLVVEENGVRVIGPEGERFIPVGGKLNGKHILATSPKIGLIVTEDSAIRVNNQEQQR